MVRWEHWMWISGGWVLVYETDLNYEESGHVDDYASCWPEDDCDEYWEAEETSTDDFFIAENSISSKTLKKSFKELKRAIKAINDKR